MNYLKILMLMICLIPRLMMGMPWYRSNYYLTKLFDDGESKNSTAATDSEYDTRSYRPRFHKLVERELEQRFRAQILVTHDLETDKAFNTNGICTSLAAHEFGSLPLNLSDIFLPAQLALSEKFVAPENTEDACSTLCDQFLPQIAPLELYFNARQSVTNLDLTFSYQAPVFEKDSLIIGYNLPLVFAKRTLDISLEKGGLSNAAFIDGGQAVDEFFKEFSSVDDFVKGYVLKECKGICYQPRARSSTIGDLGMFLSIDVGKHINDHSRAIFGLNVLMPTGHKQNGSLLWEYETGLGGVWMFSPFFYGNFSMSRFFNPHLSVAGFFSPCSSVTRRISRCISSDQTISGADTTLCLPGTLSCYTIKPFCFTDSRSALLADNCVCVSRRPGAAGMVRLGNNVFDLFGVSSLHLGFFYDGAFKAGDTFNIQQTKTSCPQNNANSNASAAQLAALNIQYDMSNLNETKRATAHIIEWLLSYQINDYLGWSLGSYHTVAGKNITKINSFFAKLAFYF